MNELLSNGQLNPTSYSGAEGYKACRDAVLRGMNRRDDITESSLISCGSNTSIYMTDAGSQALRFIMQFIFPPSRTTSGTICKLMDKLGCNMPDSNTGLPDQKKFVLRKIVTINISCLI